MNLTEWVNSKFWYTIFKPKMYGGEAYTGLDIGIFMIVGIVFMLLGLIILGKEYFKKED